MAYQTRDLVAAMEADAKTKLKQLRVDGGATTNNPLMQFQADILGVRTQRPQVKETTALGAAYLAGLAVGFWKSQPDVIKNWQLDKEFKPAMKPAKRKALYADWQKALERAKNWTS
jgi:glycerol kinase